MRILFRYWFITVISFTNQTCEECFHFFTSITCDERTSPVVFVYICTRVKEQTGTGSEICSLPPSIQAQGEGTGTCWPRNKRLCNTKMVTKVQMQVWIWGLGSGVKKTSASFARSGAQTTNLFQTNTVWWTCYKFYRAALISNFLWATTFWQVLIKLLIWHLHLQDY